jgi:hypothetical protein
MSFDKIAGSNIDIMKENIGKTRKEQSGKVVAFYNLGMNASEIAAKLNMPVGEAQQILLDYKKAEVRRD